MVGRLKGLGRAAWLPRLLVGASVALLHLLVVERVAHHFADVARDVQLPPRLQVVYLHELDLKDAPLSVAAPARTAEPALRRSGGAAAKVMSAVGGSIETIASAPLPVIEFAVPIPTVVASASEVLGLPQVVDETPSGTADAGAPHRVDAAAATDPASPIEPTAVADLVDPDPAQQPEAEQPPFEWPVSTRLSYRLAGNYRGEVAGSAQVEWINAAPRYQVNLDVTVGFPFAPLFTRRMRSDGRIVAHGLQPEHYAEASQLAFRDSRRTSLRIDVLGVRDADGRHLPSRRSASRFAVQDSASQFVQLSWLFTTRPELLTPGQLIEFDLALPRRVSPWIYEVGQAETVWTPFGAVDAVHVHPRAGTERGGDLLAQAWFAPQLAYLPVRIRIEQSADVFLDLVLDRRPELAAN